MTIISAPNRTEEFIRAVGDPSTTIAELEQAKKSGEALSSDRGLLFDDFADRWVALHDGRVIADASSLHELLSTVERDDPASRDHVLVRFIGRSKQTLIL